MSDTGFDYLIILTAVFYLVTAPVWPFWEVFGSETSASLEKRPSLRLYALDSSRCPGSGSVASVKKKNMVSDTIFVKKSFFFWFLNYP